MSPAQLEKSRDVRPRRSPMETGGWHPIFTVIVLPKHIGRVIIQVSDALKDPHCRCLGTVPVQRVGCRAARERLVLKL